LKILVLTESDIKPLLSISETVEAVETAFREKGLGYAEMPAKPYLFYRKYDGDLRVMPSYLERLGVSAVKVVNSHPNNPSRFNLPTVMATIILIDPRNGTPLAIMNGTWITAMRTGGACGVAAKYLARKDSKVVGLVGAGMQARTQLAALLSLYKGLEEVRVWSLTQPAKELERRDAFISEMKEMYRKEIGRIFPVDKVEDAVKGADIVVTATPSRKPLVLNGWISPGMHFNCIGADAPGKEELDPAILKRAKIVVDDWEQSSHGGEINVPVAEGMITKKDIWGDICEIAVGLKPGRTSSNEITVFVSSGLAVQDAITAKIVYDKAVSIGAGQFIDFS